MEEFGNYFTLLSRYRHYIAKRLLKVCSYFKAQNQLLCDELYQWLESPKKNFQVQALLALENLGVKHHELFKILREEIKNEKFVRQSCVRTTCLLILRYNNLHENL
jgi:hypothetical protein